MASASGTPPPRELTVGQVASRAGIPVSTVHFYEAEGLIRSGCTRANHRRYPRGVLRRIAIIRVAQRAGIPLKEIWVYVWSVAGFVALVTGVIWGSKLGVQFSLVLIALKALPVLILGGFTSIPGAIVGGLIIGVGEKLGEIYWGPLVGGGIESWLAYMIALIFLLFRPQGLFGERIIERI